MKIAIIWTLALSFMLPAAAAGAQETGTLITRRAAQIDDDSPTAAQKAAEDFGTCLLSRERERMAKLIDLPVDSAEYAKLFDAMFGRTDQCLSDGTLKISELMLRGALFQALYRRDFSGDTELRFDPTVQTGYRDLYKAELSDKARMYVSLENFGECVSRADPYGVRALVLSRPGSSAESAALTQLHPRLAGCVVQGNQVRFSRANLKGILAEGLYRLSRASAQQTERR